jgi:tRNA pseudouridine55 synthase
MKKILNLYKEKGETPLMRIERFRMGNPEYRDVPLSYAGRLDPMAEGVLLVVVGEENKQKEKYLALDKEYTFEVLFGFATDTYDALGLMTDAVTRASYRKISLPLLNEYISQLPGEQVQKYPPFSSKPLEGSPLFVKARKGEVAGKDFVLPEHSITIHKAVVKGTAQVSAEALLARVQKEIGRVQGDFRQERILTLWENSLRVLYGLSFDVATVHIACTSGTYVRSIAHDLGRHMGTPALALSILRTKVGRWSVRSAERE